MDGSVIIPSVPFPLRWEVPPAGWWLDERGLTIDAGPRTDTFLDPGDAEDAVRIRNAPRLLGAPGGDWLLSARVAVAMAATFDAGVLLVWVDDDTWAKLCFESSPEGVPTIVSVVTRGVSDDANAWPVPAAQTWLRVARMGPALAFHASHDGVAWQLVRQFSLGIGASPRVGFEVQSPLGEGCRATFDRIRFEPRRLDDLRGGV
jgi:regulation of enolase protein 1 (concanavalin A-like superfamily)